jgi:predicted histidine transporter YuiF (NhaC family)
VKFSFGEVVMLIGLALLAITAYNQHNQLEYAKDTIQTQHEAINKQQELINHQIRYIGIMESQAVNSRQNPIYRGPS